MRSSGQFSRHIQNSFQYLDKKSGAYFTGENVLHQVSFAKQEFQGEELGRQNTRYVCIELVLIHIKSNQ